MKNTLLSLLTTFLLISCSNDDATGDPENETNFYALNVGNSWVYKVYWYNQQTETYTDSGIVDSVSIVSKVDIDGDNFYKKRSFISGNHSNSGLFPNGERFTLVRDSLGYLIDEEGLIHYANDDFEEIEHLSYDWGTIFYKLQESKTNILVNAGSFECLDLLIYAKSPEGAQFEGLDHQYVTEGVGFVKQTISIVNSDVPTAEKRLESYSVQ